VTNFGAFQFTVQYNDAIVDFSSRTIGPFLGSTGRSTVCPFFDDPGEITFSCSSLGSAPGPNGSGVVMSATFQGLAPGISPLHLEDALLLNVSASPMAPVALVDGSVVVSGGGGGGMSGVDLRTLDGATLVADAPRSGASSHAPPSAAGATTDARVLMDPMVATAYLGGEPAIVHEVLEDLPPGVELGAFQFTIEFDPLFLEIEIEEGPLLGSTGRSTNPAFPTPAFRSVLIPARLKEGSSH
jgi:hypothetical protein